MWEVSRVRLKESALLKLESGRSKKVKEERV
jgi:hypothetical protein